MRVLVSTSNDVHHNLAIEEWLVDHFDQQGAALLFYVNRPAVVVGKNQNPWRECDVAALRRDGVALGRRISGGGTVYHDDGNLNYALIGARAEYCQPRVFERLLSALTSIGIEAEMMGGNSLGIRTADHRGGPPSPVGYGGPRGAPAPAIATELRKCSGSAFCFRGNAVLHHGTLLIHSDLARLRRYLAPALPGIETRAIASKPAGVANLAETNGALTIERVRHALAHEFAGSSAVPETPGPASDALQMRHDSWAWTHGHTPAFDWTCESSEVRLTVHVEHGVITEAVLAWCHDRQETVSALAGCAFEAALLADRLVAWNGATGEFALRLRTLGF